MNTFSFNNRFIVEPYRSDGSIKATTGSGFALISQKVSLKGLKLLADVLLSDRPSVSVDGITRPQMIYAGSTIWIREETLHSAAWAKQIMECEGIEGKFIIVDSRDVEMVSTP